MKKLYLILAVSCIIAGCARPYADYRIEKLSESVPAEVRFHNKSKSSEVYEWDFGDGNVSTKASPRHVYELSGRYSVTLKASKGDKISSRTEQIIFQAPDLCLVRFTTTMGDLVIRLSDATPKHRDNFIKLVKEKYYDDILFHRVIDKFMIQSGDPDSKNSRPGAALGIGGPGYTVEAEFVDSLAHIKGALAAARQDDQVNPEKASSGSQFYIVHGNKVNQESIDKMEGAKGVIYSEYAKEQYLANGGTPFLDQEYTVFGFLVDGFDVLDAIAKVETDPRNRPSEDIKIISAQIIK